MRNLPAALIAAIVALTTPSAPAQATSPNELKAAITFNILRYIDFPSASGPLRLCVKRGADGAQELAALGGQRIGARTIVIRGIDAGGNGDCDVVFLGQASASEISAALQRGTIVMGDGPRFVGSGGTVGLIRTGNQIRFEINLRAARETGITISSRLLRLASRVQG